MTTEEKRAVLETMGYKFGPMNLRYSTHDAYYVTPPVGQRWSVVGLGEAVNTAWLHMEGSG
jgi:hypothetical protein